MFFGFNNIESYLVVFSLIEHAKEISGCKETYCRSFKQISVDKALIESIHNLLICTTAVNVAAFFQSEFDAFFRTCGNLVILMKVSDSPTVRYVMAFEFPLSAKDIFHKI